MNVAADLSHLQLTTWTDEELRDTYTKLMGLGWFGKLTGADILLLEAVIAERMRRAPSVPSSAH